MSVELQRLHPNHDMLKEQSTILDMNELILRCVQSVYRCLLARLHEDDVKKMVQLLKTTQLSMPVIAQRFGCTKGVVCLIKIREYLPNKTWKLL